MFFPIFDGMGNFLPCPAAFFHLVSPADDGFMSAERPAGIPKNAFDGA